MPRQKSDMFAAKKAPSTPVQGASDSDSSSWEDYSSSDEEQVNIQPINRAGEKADTKAISASNGALAPPPSTDWEVSGEFHSIEKETDSKPVDYSVALERQNLKKNRYGNALPNPETRVKLKGAESDYINANYVKGEKSIYIAAQAPLPHTFADFWLMIYEQNTRVIMMLTKLQEKDRLKADVYWPRKGTGLSSTT